MRRFTIVVIVTCVLSIALFFYMEHDTRKFIKNIAHPASTTAQQKAQTQEKADPQEKAEAPRVDTQDPQNIVDKGDTPPDDYQTEPPHRHENTAHTHPHTPENYNSEPRRVLPASETESQVKNDLKKERPKPLETLKKMLIEEHGDIPLVHTYIDLRRKELNKEPLTMDEVSTLWDAIMVFNPTPANRKTYELIKRLSSQADPDRFKMIYDVPRGKK